MPSKPLPKINPILPQAPKQIPQMPWAGQKGTLEDLSSFGISPEDFFGGGGKIMFSDPAPKLTPKQGAYIEGFVKRASEYGYSQEQALGYIKKALFGDSAYKEVPEIDEEDVKSMRFRDMEDFVEPQEGEGIMAHLKRNPGKYLGGALGGLLGGGIGDAAADNPLGGAAIGGAFGATVGAVPDAVLNAFRRKFKREEAERHLNNLQRHIELQKNLNSEGQTIYNRHSLGF